MNTGVCIGEELARYHFGEVHPFGPQRYPAFLKEYRGRGLDKRVKQLKPVLANREDIELFHNSDYVEQVVRQSASGEGYLDAGDTPACKGIYEAASWVVGSTLSAVEHVCIGTLQRVMVPIAGLHHARREQAAGFCVFNDCGIAIEVLRARFGIQRIAYVDIDAHHGDGVFYSFENDPDLIFVDFHEDGRFLYPGTGDPSETGKGNAKGTKLNIAMPMGANDEEFKSRWVETESFLLAAKPEIILFQCGADSLKDDPITHMSYSALTHGWVTQRLCSIANQCCNGRIVAMGGGGYNLDNVAQAWCAVVEGFLST